VKKRKRGRETALKEKGAVLKRRILTSTKEEVLNGMKKNHANIKRSQKGPTKKPSLVIKGGKPLAVPKEKGKRGRRVRGDPPAAGPIHSSEEEGHFQKRSFCFKERRRAFGKGEIPK